MLPAMGAEAVWARLAYAERFFTGKAESQQAMRKLATALDELAIPYAIIGGMALNAHGYQRVTIDVDVLLRSEGLQRFKDHWLGNGYVEKVPGGRRLRDVENDVGIDVFITGGYPGDGQPKPVQFPDPAEVAVRCDGISFISLAKLIELKFVSGLSALQRMKDLGDVIELIKHAMPGRELVDLLDPSVRAKYLEFWDVAQLPDPLPQ